MFQVITVSSSPERSHVVRHLVHATGQLMPLRELDTPLDEVLAQRVLALHHPDALIVDLEGGEQSALAAYYLRKHAANVPIIGLGGSEEVRASVTDLGFEALTSARPEAAELLSAVGSALHRSCGAVEEKLLSFLPAKAGGGCSTVVLNTAVALARLGRKVVVIEADLRSGALTFVLDRPVRNALQSLLSDSGAMDSFRVENCVTRAHGVDWLLSNRSIEAALPCWYDYFRLLELVRQRYDFVLVDLPELVNAASVEFVRRSGKVFAVCTPELLSLRLCAQRIEELNYWSVPSERISLIVNRWHANDLEESRIAEMLGRPVAQILPNDYRSARAAVTEARAVDPESRLGQAFTRFACGLAGETFTPPAAKLSERLRSVFARS